MSERLLASHVESTIMCRARFSRRSKLGKGRAVFPTAATALFVCFLYWTALSWRQYRPRHQERAKASGPPEEIPASWRGEDRVAGGLRVSRDRRHTFVHCSESVLRRERLSSSLRANHTWLCCPVDG